jgi:hypothetical protein
MMPQNACVIFSECSQVDFGMLPSLEDRLGSMQQCVNATTRGGLIGIYGATLLLIRSLGSCS